jgi:hypothetical protein
MRRPSPELDISLHFMYNYLQIMSAIPGYRGLDQGPPHLWRVVT